MNVDPQRQLVITRLTAIQTDIGRVVALCKQGDDQIETAIDVLEPLPEDLMITFMALESLRVQKGE